MTKKEICLKNPAFAYYSGFSGLELHKIEYGIEDYIYCTSGAWTGKKSYHTAQNTAIRSNITRLRWFILG